MSQKKLKESNFSHRKVNLGLNIDHVATLRNARKEKNPSPIAFALLAQICNTDSITIHLREDERHIQESDLKYLKKYLDIPLNLEVSLAESSIQQALKYLLQDYSNNVRFCLICNYISRIDEGLQNEFLRLRFNQLPEENIICLLKNISKFEKLNIEEKSLGQIQKIYKSDIRSMINYMQSNQHIINYDFYIIDNSVWENLYLKCLELKREDIWNHIREISKKYNINKKNIIKDFLNYIIRNKEKIVTYKLLNFIENIMHFPECKQEYYINYTLLKLSLFFSETEDCCIKNDKQ
jgi:DNA polymerase III delta prime subunit